MAVATKKWPPGSRSWLSPTEVYSDQPASCAGVIFSRVPATAEMATGSDRSVRGWYRSIITKSFRMIGNTTSRSSSC